MALHSIALPLTQVRFARARLNVFSVIETSTESATVSTTVTAGRGSNVLKSRRPLTSSTSTVPLGGMTPSPSHLMIVYLVLLCSLFCGICILAAGHCGIGGARTLPKAVVRKAVRVGCYWCILNITG